MISFNNLRNLGEMLSALHNQKPPYPQSEAIQLWLASKAIIYRIFFPFHEERRTLDVGVSMYFLYKISIMYHHGVSITCTQEQLNNAGSLSQLKASVVLYFCTDPGSKQ